MIIKSADIQKSKVPLSSSVYVNIHEQGISTPTTVRLNEDFVVDDKLQVRPFLQFNNFIASNANDDIKLSFEIRDYVTKDTLILSDSNRSKDEVLIDLSDYPDEVFMEFVNGMMKYNEAPLYISKGGEHSLIINMVAHANNKVVLVLEDSLSTISRGETFDIFYGEFDTGIEDFIFNFKEIIRPTVVLTGHREKNLNNYDYQDEKQDSVTKLYKDLDDTISDTFTTEDYVNLKQTINYSFKEFENHVRFGSAHAKIVNAEEKVNKIREYQDELTGQSNYSQSSIDKLNKLIRDTIDGFTLYEDYVYTQYTSKTESEFDTWVTDQKEEAELYDLQNPEFILFLVPSHIIESDDTGYFTNFILLLGEFFDNIWIYVEALSNVKERNFYTDFEISDEFVIDALRDLGINKETRYTDADLTDYFTGSTNLKQVSNIISKRLLYNLPFLYKSKGTRAVVDQVLNVFGVPKGIIDVYEFGTAKKDTTTEVVNNDFEFYLRKDGSADEVTPTVSRTELGDDFTLEIMFNNLEDGSGNIMRLDADHRVDYTKSGSVIELEVINGGVSIYNSGFVFQDNDQWTYLSVSRDVNDFGTIFSWQQDKSGYGITNEVSDVFTWTSTGTFSDIQLLYLTAGSITEFRAWNSVLTKTEAEEHASDFRSIAEEEFPSTLYTRFKFYKPDSDFSKLDSIDGTNETAPLLDITESDFLIDEFFNYSRVIHIPSEEVHSEKVRIEDRKADQTSLSGVQRVTSYEYDRKKEDANILGLFISPTDKLNTAIIRRIGDFQGLIPSEFDDGDYTFEYLDEKKKYLDELNLNYSDLTVYQSLLRIFNRRVFNLLEDFLPATTQLQYGLMIKNHILDKSRGYKNKKDGNLKKNYHIPQSVEKTFNNNEAQTLYNNVTVIAGKQENIQANKVNLEDKFTLKVITDNSRFSLNIRNETTISKAPFYVKKSIVGGRSNPPSPEEVDLLKNSGASILVT